MRWRARVDSRSPTEYPPTISAPTSASPAIHPCTPPLPSSTCAPRWMTRWLSISMARLLSADRAILLPPPTTPSPPTATAPAWATETLKGRSCCPRPNPNGGDNVIAVLLKQGSPTSSDITMGLELEGIIPVVVQPLSLTVTRDGSGGLVVSWTDSTATLQETTNLTPPRTWTPPASGALAPTSLTLTPAQAAASARKFWRLTK